MFQTRWIPMRLAKEFIKEHHRHHRAPTGAIVCLGLFLDERLVGVAAIGRPVARNSDTGLAAEVTRLCVLPEVKNAASQLNARARRVAQSLGFTTLGSYTLPEEGGASMRAIGAKLVRETRGGGWNRDSRPREAGVHPEGAKHFWEIPVDPPPPFKAP